MGVARIPRIDGTDDAMSQSMNGFVNGIPMPMAICMHRKFCAAALTSRHDVTFPPCNCCDIKYVLVRGSKLLTMGTKTPAARAVVDGIAGDRNASAVCNPYASFSVLLPNALTNSSPSLSPNPVLMNALAKNDATTMSQMTWLVSDERPCSNVRVLVMTVNVSDMKHHMPTGAGLTTRPATVVQNIARSLQASRDRSTGHGTTKYTARPMATENIVAGRFTPRPSPDQIGRLSGSSWPPRMGTGERHAGSSGLERSQMGPHAGFSAFSAISQSIASSSDPSFASSVSAASSRRPTLGTMVPVRRPRCGTPGLAPRVYVVDARGRLQQCPARMTARAERSRATEVRWESGFEPRARPGRVLVGPIGLDNLPAVIIPPRPPEGSVGRALEVAGRGIARPGAAALAARFIVEPALPEQATFGQFRVHTPG